MLMTLPGMTEFSDINLLFLHLIKAFLLMRKRNALLPPPAGTLSSKRSEKSESQQPTSLAPPNHRSTGNPSVSHRSVEQNLEPPGNCSPAQEKPRRLPAI